MRYLMILAIVVMATGCETLRRPEELAWQSMHVVDTLQTLKIVNDDCLYEKNPVTQLLIGKKPSTHGVIAWGIGAAGAHLLVSDALIARDMPRAYAVWQLVNIGTLGATIANNHAIGIRIGKPNKTACARRPPETAPAPAGPPPRIGDPVHPRRELPID